MSDALQQALRAEIFAVLNENQGLTPAQCSTLMRLSEHARELLRARSKKPEDFVNGTEHAGDAEVPMVNTETYGVKMIRELIPMLQGSFNKPKTTSKRDLVLALAEARSAGLDDVVKELEIELGVRPAATIDASKWTGPGTVEPQPDGSVTVHMTGVPAGPFIPFGTPVPLEVPKEGESKSPVETIFEDPTQLLRAQASLIAKQQDEIAALKQRLEPGTTP